MRSEILANKIIKMRCVAILLGLSLLTQGIIAADSPSLVLTGSGLGQKTYPAYLKDCEGISDAEALDACMQRVEPNGNLWRIEPINYIRWSVPNWLSRRGYAQEDTIDAVIRAAKDVISEMPVDKDSVKLARAALLADQIRSRTVFDACALKNSQNIAGCYTFDKSRESLNDPAEGIFLSPDSVKIVCGDKFLGGTRVCAATYAHEIAHMLVRTLPGFNPDAVRNNEVDAFYYEYKFLNQVFSYEANRDNGRSTQTEKVEDYHAFADALNHARNGIAVDGQIRQYPDPVKKYFEHLAAVLATNGELYGGVGGQGICYLVKSLGYQDTGPVAVQKCP